MLFLEKEIRNKLQEGYTIDNICSEYDLTFEEVLKMMDAFKDVEDNQSNDSLYISKSRDKFKIRKCNVNYGSYNSLEDAKRVRDYLIHHNWIVNDLDTICNLLKVERCKKDYTNIRHKNGRYYVMGSEDDEYKLFGTYETLDDAVKIRDYCKKNGWKRKSVDKYCEILGVKRIKSAYELKHDESLYH
jgi:hypothetical protein